MAGPGEVRDSISPIAQGWRDSASRAEIARSRIAVLQSVPPEGSSISPKTSVDHAVEELVLVGDVVVERHRLDPERFAELAHAERRDPALVGERDGDAEHPLAGQRDAGLGGGLGACAISILPLDKLTV